MNYFQQPIPVNAFHINNSYKIGYQTFNLCNFNQFPIMKKARKIVKKSKFSKKEDEKLTNLVEKYGENEWILISHHMEKRNPRQCRERWKNCLNPKFIKKQWSEEEDALLLKKFQENGHHWNLITQYFPNRSMYSIRNRIIKLIKMKKEININTLFLENNINETKDSINTLELLDKSNSFKENSKFTDLNNDCSKSYFVTKENHCYNEKSSENENSKEEINEIFDIFWDPNQEIEVFTL